MTLRDAVTLLLVAILLAIIWTLAAPLPLRGAPGPAVPVTGAVAVDAGSVHAPIIVGAASGSVSAPTWHGISWYCWPGGDGAPRSRCTRGVPWTSLAAAYGPRSGFHRGDRLRLTYRGRSVVVTIRDYCPTCGGGLDVYASAFRRLAPLSAGRIMVQATLVGRGR